MMPRKKRIKAATKHRRVLAATREHYDDVLELQGGHCALCPTPPKDGRRMDTDHNHATLEVRGLLCQRCNRFGVKDWMTKEWAENLVAYLDDPPYQQVLRRKVL
jgi:hypothetical protein